jgi:hypothetical protein
MDAHPVSAATAFGDGRAESASQPIAQQGISRIRSADMNVWVFSEQAQMVRVETSPGELSASLWAKLNAYVQVLKPKNHQEERV